MRARHLWECGRDVLPGPKTQFVVTFRASTRVPELGDITRLDVDLPRDGNLLLEVVLLRNLRIAEYNVISLRTL